MAGRSHCDRCGRQIATYDLIPLISFLILNGKCRICGQKIGFLSMATELVAIIAALVPLAVLPQDQAVGLAIFAWILLPLILLDFAHLWLPDRLILILATGGFLAGPLLDPDLAVMDRGIGVLAGFLSLEVVRQLYRQLRNADGMGAGDPKLFGALGAWLGWQALPMTLFIASFVGLLIILFSHRSKNLAEVAFPLGSYLGIGAYITALAPLHF